MHFYGLRTGRPRHYLRGYLASLDELLDSSGVGVGAEKRRSLMMAWGPWVKSPDQVQNLGQNPYSVADRRFLSLGSEPLIQALGADGRVTWDGLPPGKGYRVGILSGARIRFVGAASPDREDKVKKGILAALPSTPAGIGVSPSFDLSRGVQKEIVADFVSPEAQIRFIMPRELLPTGAICHVSIHSIALSANQKIVGLSQVDEFVCKEGVNQRSVDVDGHVYVKFIWRLPEYRFRFRSYAALLQRGSEIDLGRASWLDGGRVCRIRWKPMHSGAELPISRSSPVPEMQLSFTLKLDPQISGGTSLTQNLDTYWFIESMRLGTEWVLEGLSEGELMCQGHFSEPQKAALQGRIAKTLGIDDASISDPRVTPLRQDIGPAAVMEVAADFSFTGGTEILLPGLTIDSGMMHAILVGGAVRTLPVRVSVKASAKVSSKSGTRVLIRGKWKGTAALWLENTDAEHGLRAWQVASIQAGVQQSATAQEAKIIRVRLRVVQKDGKLASGGLIGAYANHAGSLAAGLPLIGHRMALLDKAGECTMLLPVGSTWSIRHGTLKTLSLLHRPGVKEIKVSAGTTLIELQ